MPQNPTLSITGLGIISGAGHGVRESLQIFNETPMETKLGSDLPVITVQDREEWRTELVDENPLKVNLLALACAREALKMAGLDDLRGLRVGVCLGSTVGCSNFQPAFSLPYNLGEFPDPSPLLSHFKNNSAQFLLRALNCKGPSLLVSNACTSGADAIGIASQWLKADLCDVVICGGTEEILPQIYYGFKSMLLCSPQVCTPFDKNRSGLTLGEGAGIIILEKANSPRKPVARLLGYASTSDAYHPTAPHPEGKFLNLAVEKVLSQAQLKQVDFINVHGTATEHNDLAEGTWIREHAAQTPVVATKGYTGHTLAAAGAVETVLTVMSLMEQKLPISKGFREADPRMGISPTTSVASGLYENALSFSLGFGGTNAVVALGRA